MCLKTPKFWYEPFGLSAAALAVPSLFYGVGRKAHVMASRPYKAEMPVLCVGNLVAGGAGKTPTALAIAQLVKDKVMAKKPCFLSRGYGRKTQNYFLVNKDAHTAAEVGDEPLLLARTLDTIVAVKRKDGVKYAASNNYDLVIMDDGMQNQHIRKDLCLTVIDGAVGFGNKMLLPAGPLREPLKAGLARSDAFIIIGNDEQNVQSKLPAGKPVFKGRIEVPEHWVTDTSIPYVAFSGLGRPEKFCKTIENKKLNLVSFHAFPDHYDYRERDINKLTAEAKEKNARLLTTEKDAQRLPHDKTQDLPIDIMPIELQWEDRDAIATFLQAKLENL